MRSDSRSIFAGVGIAMFVAATATAGDADPQEFTQIERGQYLAILSDCASCHTVPGSNQPFAALPDKHLDDEAISLGAQCLLRKPFETTSLLECIERSLR